jgi:hypothetical protein
MNDPRIAGLLREGGLDVEDLSAILVDGGAPRYKGLRNPAATEELACALAAEVAALAPRRVLLWDDDDDVLLAFVVARELHCLISRAWNFEGLLQCDPPIEGGDRVVVMGESFRNVGSLKALRSLAEIRDSKVVAVAVLIETPVLRAEAGDGRVIALLQRSTQRTVIAGEEL